MICEQEQWLKLLGAFRLEIAGKPVRLPSGAQRLLALLCLHGPTSRRRLAGTLWPETTDAQALTNLRHVLWRLQNALADQVLPDQVLIVATGSDIELAASVASDVTSLLHQRLPLLSDRAALTQVDLLRPGGAELLPDWDDEWLVAERERLRQLRLHLLERWADTLAAQGHYCMALEVALAALRTDNLRESAHRTVIRVHLAEGNLSEARRAFSACRRVLRAEIGVEPSPQTHSLVGLLPKAASG